MHDYYIIESADSISRDGLNSLTLIEIEHVSTIETFYA